MYIGNNAAIRGCQEYFNRCSAAGSPIGATQTPSSYDNAASFDGASQFLSVADNSTLNLSGTNFTLSCWYFVSALNTANAYVFGKAVLNLLPLDYGFRINANTTTTQFLWSTSGSYSFLTGPSVVLGAWNHLAIVFDGTNMTMYGNGVAGTPVAMPSAIQNTANPFAIARCGSNNNQYLNGRVAGFGIWKRALTASEVSQLWNNGAGRTYASLDTGLRTNLISWWALNQNGVTADSAPTGNNLTNNGTPLVTATTLGPVVTSLADPRQLIIDFAQGIDQLGLWNSMVCWPLRSSQNAGSGTTAFSLGGLGQFNGSLVNAPTWGANGMVFSSSLGTRIDISNDPIFAPQNTTWGAMAVSNQTSMPGGYGGVFGKNSINDNLTDIGWNLREVNTNLQPQVSNGTTQALYNIASVGFNSFRSSMFSYDNANVTGRVNGGTAVSSPYTPNAQQLSSQTLRIGSGPTGATSAYFNGQIAFTLFGHFSASQQVALHALYRQTLGLGLNLP